MNKKILILIVIVLVGVLSIIFYNRNTEDYYMEFANKIVDLYQGKKDDKGIKKDDLKAFNDFYKRLSHEDELVDITEYFEFDNVHKVSGEPAIKATYTNNKCFIKYQNLDLWTGFDNANEGDAIFQRVTCNGYETILFETMFMPPYEEIIDNPKYIYIFDSYEESLSGYSFKYKSTYDDSLLTLKLVIEDKQIIEVEVSYD